MTEPTPTPQAESAPPKKRLTITLGMNAGEKKGFAELHTEENWAEGLKVREVAGLIAAGIISLHELALDIQRQTGIPMTDMALEQFSHQMRERKAQAAATPAGQ